MNEDYYFPENGKNISFDDVVMAAKDYFEFPNNVTLKVFHDEVFEYALWLESAGCLDGEDDYFDEEDEDKAPSD